MEVYFRAFYSRYTKLIMGRQPHKGSINNYFLCVRKKYYFERLFGKRKISEISLILSQMSLIEIVRSYSLRIDENVLIHLVKMLLLIGSVKTTEQTSSTYY